MYLIKRPLKGINRIRELINVLAKYGFSEIIENTPLKRLLYANGQINWPSKERKQVAIYNRWENLRMVVEELGPTFIKLAQLLSNRPDLLPEKLIIEFEKLQDKVPSFPTRIAKSIIEAETGKKLDELFSYFDDNPLGSASIGQVHRARLITGEDVVVKIQRPKVTDQVRTDLDLLRQFVKLTENYFVSAGILNPLQIVETFEKSMLKELDYSIEARHMEQFRKIYKNHDSFYVPKPYKEFSTTHILVIEFISGCKITDTQRLKEWGLDLKKLAQVGTEIYLTQVFEYGFFHADPHPGNVLVKPNGKIVLIDFGMVGKLMKPQKYAFAGVFINLAQQNPRGMAINLRRLAVEHEIEEMKVFEYALGEMIEDFIVLDVDNAGMADLTRRLQKIIYQYKLKVPGAIFLILRALAMLEGISKVLDPSYQPLEAIKPYGSKVLQEEFSLKNIGTDVYYSFSKLMSLVYNLPQETKDIIKKIRKGKLFININHQGYEPMLEKLDSIVNKLILTMLICSFLLASSISLNVDVSPTYASSNGIPYISLIGFIISGVLSLFLFFAMMRNGR